MSEAQSSTPSPTVRTPSQPVPADEPDLIRRAQAGDLDAFDELVRRHQERIYGVIYHMTGHHADAADLAQETFVKAWSVLKSFKGNSSLFTWLYRIAVNKTINHLKSPRNRRHASLNDLEAGAENDPVLVALVSDKTPRREAAISELPDRLNAALMKLSDEHRLVVTMHDIQGLPHGEIAQILDCNPGTVRSRLFYARQQLQAWLSDYMK